MVNGQLTDVETGSTWDVVSGKAKSGELVGATLLPLPAIVSFTEVWKGFHPDTTIVGDRTPVVKLAPWNRRNPSLAAVGWWKPGGGDDHSQPRASG
jgi:hypothetical protein